MNPDSGPGPRQNLDYVNTVNKTTAAGVRVLGYVYTDYGDRSLSDVTSDIDNYYKWYNVDGVFLDEAEYRDCTDDAYYQNLYNHIKAKGGQVILNPGTQTEECYADSADVIVNFEGTYDAYARETAPALTNTTRPNRPGCTTTHLRCSGTSSTARQTKLR